MSKVNTINAIDELMLEEGIEREVRAVFGKGGKFKVYEVDKKFLDFIGELIEKNKENEEFELTDIETTRAMFLLLTNFEEDFPQLLEKEKFEKIYNHPRKVFSKIAEELAVIASEEVITYVDRIDRFNKMPNSFKRRLAEKHRKEMEDKNNNK